MNIVLSPSDRALLTELGFSNSQTLSEKEKLVTNLTMRQLDRLKMMFSRVQSSSPDSLSDELKMGIFLNDSSAFAAAVSLLLRES